MRGVAVSLVAFALFAGAAPGPAWSQDLTGVWQSTVTEVSNTCGNPLGSPEMSQLDIVQEGNLIDIDVVGGGPGVTEISGAVSGSQVAIGFEVFDPGAAAVEVYDPALNNLTISPDETTISGDLNWERYAALECAGTQTWSGTKNAAGTPGDLSGSWTVTVTEVSDSCGPIDPQPLVIPVVTVVHEGDLVDVSTVPFGQTRIIGRVAGQTLNLGLAIKESEGDLTVFDSADNSLTIDGSFASFTGLMTWESYEALDCTGVDSIVAVVPEPTAALCAVALIGSVSLVGARRRRAFVRPPLAAAMDRSTRHPAGRQLESAIATRCSSRSA